MPVFRILAILLVFPLLVSNSEAPRFAWLTGDWIEQRANGRWTSEHWEPMRGGTLLGVGQSGRGDTARGFDYMRIVDGPDGATFHGSPQGAPAVAFREMTGARGPAAVTFANTAHDYPKRIAYHRVGVTLTATISGADPAKDSITWTYRRCHTSSRSPDASAMCGSRAVSR